MITYTDEIDLFKEDSLQQRYREELGNAMNSRFNDFLAADMLGIDISTYDDSKKLGITIPALQYLMSNNIPYQNLPLNVIKQEYPEAFL